MRMALRESGEGVESGWVVGAGVMVDVGVSVEVDVGVDVGVSVEASLSPSLQAKAATIRIRVPVVRRARNLMLGLSLLAGGLRV